MQLFPTLLDSHVQPSLCNSCFKPCWFFSSFGILSSYPITLNRCYLLYMKETLETLEATRSSSSICHWTYKPLSETFLLASLLSFFLSYEERVISPVFSGSSLCWFDILSLVNFNISPFVDTFHQTLSLLKSLSFETSTHTHTPPNTHLKTFNHPSLSSL